MKTYSQFLFEAKRVSLAIDHDTEAQNHENFRDWHHKMGDKFDDASENSNGDKASSFAKLAKAHRLAATEHNFALQTHQHAARNDEWSKSAKNSTALAHKHSLKARELEAKLKSKLKSS